MSVLWVVEVANCIEGEAHLPAGYTMVIPDVLLPMWANDESDSGEL